MSVINKMLRDLDQRKPSASGAEGGQANAQGRQGTATVPTTQIFTAQENGDHGVRWGAAALVLGLVALAGAGWWWQMRAPAVPIAIATAPIVPASVAVVAPAASAPALPAPASSASAPVMAAAVGPKPVPEAIDIVKPASPPKSESKQSRPDAAVAAKLSATVASPTTIALRMETALEMRSPKEPSTGPRATPAPPVDRAKPVPSEASGKVASAAATQEALAQAQTLWNAGSKDAAAELLRDAVSIAERSAGPNGANATLIALVRELTRMQLAEGHFGAVWDLLNRLEPHLGNQADLWAIRANAAQRLGRHQDSVHAYMVALQSRPTEQRWLLGSAVSLAALGQIASAAEMADKARAAGPISKDVQAYLRQMNVPVRD